MITLNVEGYCQNCPRFEPTANKLTLFSSEDCAFVQTEIVCQHREQCDTIAKFLRKELEIERGGC